MDGFIATVATLLTHLFYIYSDVPMDTTIKCHFIAHRCVPHRNLRKGLVSTVGRLLACFQLQLLAGLRYLPLKRGPSKKLRIKFATVAFFNALWFWLFG